MKPIKIIEKYYPNSHPAKKILIKHSISVAQKALSICDNVPTSVNRDFIYEASLLHDIGIFKTNAPGIGCTGDLPYLCHGYLGRAILENENLPIHALVCERHTGTGISKDEIINNKLPLPHRDLIPESLEEKIVCLADKFYSKNEKNITTAKSLLQIEQELSRFGEHKVEEFRFLLTELQYKN